MGLIELEVVRQAALAARELRREPPIAPLLIDVRSEREARADPPGFEHARIPLFELPTWDGGDDRARDFARLGANRSFVAAIEQLFAAHGMNRGDPLLLFCPTALRARGAARRLRQAGFLRPYALRLEVVRMLLGHSGSAATARALFTALQFSGEPS